MAWYQCVNLAAEWISHRLSVVDELAMCLVTDEPIIAFRRNVFCPLDVEKQVCTVAEWSVLELIYNDVDDDSDAAGAAAANKHCRHYCRHHVMTHRHDIMSSSDAWVSLWKLADKIPALEWEMYLKCKHLHSHNVDWADRFVITLMARNGLLYANVPLRNYSLTHAVLCDWLYLTLALLDVHTVHNRILYIDMLSPLPRSLCIYIVIVFICLSDTSRIILKSSGWLFNKFLGR